MDDSTEKLLARLDRATGPDTPASETPATENSERLDDETAMLRESWLALGKLLDAADAGSQKSEVSSQKVEASLRKLLEATDGKSEQRPGPQLETRGGLPFRFIAALAASLLVAFAVWTIMKRGTDVVNPPPVVAVGDDLPGAAATDVTEAPQDGEPLEVIDEFGWEDSFDEQLAATSQAIRSVQAGWNGGDRRYSVLLDQFEQFDEELSEGSL